MPGEKESSSGGESAWFFHDELGMTILLAVFVSIEHDGHAQLLVERVGTRTSHFWGRWSSYSLVILLV